MKIKSVEIQNFRNIDNAKYEGLGSRVAFVGENHIGKTNCLEAIYWCLSDILLNGSSEVDSIIPSTDKRKKCNVKLTMDDGQTISKSYQEKWTKTRGTDIEVLTGHETSYVVNGITQKTKNSAIIEIHRIIAGGDEKMKNFERNGLNLYNALINPFYLTEQIKWQDFRSFIIALVGNINDDDVFQKYPNLNPIKEDLNILGGRTDMLSRKYFEEVRNLEGEKKSQQVSIGIYSEKKKPDDKEYEEASKALYAYDEEIKAIKNGQSNNPGMKLIMEEIEAENEKVAKLTSEVAEETSANLELYRSESQKAYGEMMDATKRLNSLNDSRDKLKNSKEESKTKMENAKMLLEDSKERLEALRKKYVEDKEAKFAYPEEVKCPKCGTVINQESIDKARQDFENSRQALLEEDTRKGKTEATKCSFRQSIIDSLMKENHAKPEDLDGEIAKASNDLSLKTEIYKSITQKESKIKPMLEDERKKVNQLYVMKEAIESKQNEDSEKKLIDYKEMQKAIIEKAQATVDSLVVWKDAQRSMDESKRKILTLNKEITEGEEKKELLSEFILKKLGMVNESTKKVFPDIDFVLIEDNIKEGSFSEVCYPLIPHRKVKVPYADGSSSEKVLTGIAIIEDIRKYLNLDEAPILFDEGETLDSSSITSIDTECQIITSIVRDGYKKPTMVSLERKDNK
jgi:chromosome segregation ATPase